MTHTYLYSTTSAHVQIKQQPLPRRRVRNNASSCVKTRYVGEGIHQLGTVFASGTVASNIIRLFHTVCKCIGCAIRGSTLPSRAHVVHLISALYGCQCATWTHNVRLHQVLAPCKRRQSGSKGIIVQTRFFSGCTMLDLGFRYRKLQVLHRPSSLSQRYLRKPGFCR
jgi:hypothetical protein